MEKFVLQTENLTKKYGTYTVLDNVSISLEKKHIYGFIGENGAGKSTFMKIITGLTYPTSGTYSIMGKESSREREKMRRHIGSMIEMETLLANHNPKMRKLTCPSCRRKIWSLEVYRREVDA